MKIHTGAQPESRSGAVPSHDVGVLALVDTFRATLQRVRRTEEPPVKDASRRVAAKDRTQQEREPSSGKPVEDEPDAVMVRPEGVLDFWARHQWRTSAGVPESRASAEAAVAAEIREMFRLRRPGATNARSCVEVSHSKSGMKFVLSRESDTWLLAIDSTGAPTGAELRFLTAALNSRFGGLGLGAIDVIVT